MMFHKTESGGFPFADQATHCVIGRESLIVQCKPSERAAVVRLQPAGNCLPFKGVSISGAHWVAHEQLCDRAKIGGRRLGSGSLPTARCESRARVGTKGT